MAEVVAEDGVQDRIGGRVGIGQRHEYRSVTKSHATPVHTSDASTKSHRANLWHAAKSHATKLHAGVNDFVARGRGKS